VSGVETVFADGNFPESQKDHDADAVVEQRFAGDLDFQFLRSPCLLQYRQHRDGIRRRDQRPKQQAIDEADLNADQRKHQPGQNGDNHRRNPHTDGRQQRNQPLLSGQIIQIDVQRPGEQQETEQAVHQGLVEVDARDDRFRLPLHFGKPQSEQNQSEGKQQSNDHQPDGRRQPEPTVIDVAEQSRQSDQQRDDLEKIHRQIAAPVEQGIPVTKRTGSIPPLGTAGASNESCRRQVDLASLIPGPAMAHTTDWWSPLRSRGT